MFTMKPSHVAASSETCTSRGVFPPSARQPEPHDRGAALADGDEREPEREPGAHRTQLVPEPRRARVLERETRRAIEP